MPEPLPDVFTGEDDVLLAYVKQSHRGFDVIDETIGGQIVYSSVSRPRARRVARALAEGEISCRDAVMLPDISGVCE
jgi:hypothetical protein